MSRAIAPLEELRQAYPGADIFLNGELTVDFPEDILAHSLASYADAGSLVRIPLEPNQMATAALVGNRIKFEYCEVGRAIALLNGQYAVGNVEVKIVQFRSKYDI